MNPADTYINATDARKNFFDLIEKVKKSPNPINITVKGIPEAVIMSKEDYDSWVETMDVLSDPELMGKIREGDEDIKAGRIYTLEQVEQEMIDEGLLILNDKGKAKYVSGGVGKRSEKRSKKA